jgi:hypothetical protein
MMVIRASSEKAIMMQTIATVLIAPSTGTRETPSSPFGIELIAPSAPQPTGSSHAVAVLTGLESLLFGNIVAPGSLVTTTMLCFMLIAGPLRKARREIAARKVLASARSLPNGTG